MGMRIFSTSSYDKSSFEESNLPNPKPDNYSILKNYQEDRFLLLKIKYLDCINYEGNKILLFENCTLEEIQKQKLIDPHFSENKNFKSPIARFEPSQKGWNIAKLLIKTIK